MPKYFTYNFTDEEIKVSTQKELGVATQLLDFTYRAPIKVESDKRNIVVSNICAIAKLNLCNLIVESIAMILMLLKLKNVFILNQNGLKLIIKVVLISKWRH